GVAVTSFTLAVDRNFKSAQGERETDFINIVVWRQLAENCANFLSKGKLAAVDGRLQIRSYEGQDGQKRTVAEVVAEDVRFLSPKEGSSNYTAPAAAPSYNPAPNYQKENLSKEEPILATDDDLAF